MSPESPELVVGKWNMIRIILIVVNYCSTCECFIAYYSFRFKFYGFIKVSQRFFGLSHK